MNYSWMNIPHSGMILNTAINTTINFLGGKFDGHRTHTTFTITKTNINIK